MQVGTYARLLLPTLPARLQGRKARRRNPPAPGYATAADWCALATYVCQILGMCPMAAKGNGTGNREETRRTKRAARRRDSRDGGPREGEAERGLSQRIRHDALAPFGRPSFPRGPYRIAVLGVRAGGGDAGIGYRPLAVRRPQAPPSAPLAQTRPSPTPLHKPQRPGGNASGKGGARQTRRPPRLAGESYIPPSGSYRGGWIM